MEGTQNLIREFSLSPPGKGGVSCDADGAFVGAIPILNRLRQGGKDEWHPRDCEELSRQMGVHCGLPIDMSSKTGGLRAIANALRAAAKVGPGGGRFHGTTMHSAFRMEVDALGNSNLLTERSYLNGVPVNYRTPGSVRLDVVEGPIANPTAIYDLKTGSATLTRSRIGEIQSHLPPSVDKVPVKEVRP